ncbi:MAG: MFS transporter [Pseudomonadota bacterium]
MSTKASRLGVFSWMLFDWANQPYAALILTFIFAPYFAASVVGDTVAGQAIWGTTVAIAGVITAILAPIFGAIADRTGARKPWVIVLSVPFIVGCWGLWYATPGMADPLFVLIAFGIAFLGAELSIIFVNAMLPTLGDRSEIGRISGTGWAIGYCGGLVSLLLVLLLISPVPGNDTTLLGIPPIFGLDQAAGEPARAVGPLSAIWFVLFALPFFLFTPDLPRAEPIRTAIGGGLRDLSQTIREVRGHRRLFTYLLASMMYRDAMTAIFVFGGIYASGVLEWNTFQLGVFGIVAAAVGALGAWLGGYADSFFGPRPVIMASIWSLIVICIVILLTARDSIAFIPVPPDSNLPDIVFYCAGALLGAASGILNAASRTMLIHEADGHVESAQAFGLYALSGKATSFIGPALIATATAATGSQHLGISPVLGMFIIGLLLMSLLRPQFQTAKEGRI